MRKCDGLGMKIGIVKIEENTSEKPCLAVLLDCYGDIHIRSLKHRSSVKVSGLQSIC